MDGEYFHTPVMLRECLEALRPADGSVIVDATCGEGGHSAALAGLVPRGKLVCIDRNPAILERARARLAGFHNVFFFNGTFDRIAEALDAAGADAADGVLADLGLSMFHFKGGTVSGGPRQEAEVPSRAGSAFVEGPRQEAEVPSRTGSAIVSGFSYLDEGPLDMRLDASGPTAADVVNRYRENELADIIYQYGEEHEARRIAKAILAGRPIKNARELADIVFRAKRRREGRIHPATRVFQALRIHVNDELGILERFIPLCAERICEGGRLAVISYHSLEDRIVKNGFRALKTEGLGEILTKKPLIPSDGEVRDNKAARSAKLRLFERRSRSDEQERLFGDEGDLHGPHHHMPRDGDHRTEAGSEGL